MAEVVFTTQARHEEPGTAVLVITCMAYDTQVPVHEFLASHLKLAEGGYHLLAVPGGPHFLMLSDYLPKFGWVAQKWLSFAVETLGVTRVILIGHEDCRWATDDRFVAAFLHRLGHGDKSPNDRQRDELKETVIHLSGLFSRVAFEAYFMAKGADGHLQFSREV
jgi:hypothetical protein